MKSSKGIAAKDSIEFMLKSLNIAYVKEFQFSSKRKFRFDFCIPEHLIAIEYEGIYSHQSGKSRHTTYSGYTEDAVKYNLAVVEGWRVLRYTASNVANLLTDIKQLLKQ